MPWCCGKKCCRNPFRRWCGMGTFGWCCCCCTVPISKEKLPLLETSDNSQSTDASEVRELCVSESYLSSKNKTVTQSKVRIVTTSDTHMHHQDLHLPPGDILIVAGDITNWSTTTENSEVVMQWLSGLTQYQHKIVISGNHEVGIDENDPIKTAAEFKKRADTIYLQDSSFEAFGLMFYGSPWHPKRGCCFHAEAFGKPTAELKQIFGDIPSSTDIMITHVPPYGVRDLERAGHVGSDSLLQNVRDRVKPILHIFGHVHGQRGIERVQGTDTVFVNTATMVHVFDIILGANDSKDVNDNVSTLEEIVPSDIEDGSNLGLIRNEVESDSRDGAARPE